MANIARTDIVRYAVSIRKATIINKYLPVIHSWEEPYFLTLTVRSVPFQRLHDVMRSMIKGFMEITSTYRKRSQRGKGINLIGIRSLECNFNPKAKTYNPHFHIIVSNSKTAKIIKEEWLKRSKAGWTASWAQKSKRVYNSTTALIEIVKYGSKIFTEPDVNKKSNWW